MQALKIGIIGLGTVGSSLVEMIREFQKNSDYLSNPKLEIAGLCTRRPDSVTTKTDIPIQSDYQAILEDPNIDLVVELVGGTGIAKEIVMGALSRGKTVVTANKALLSEFGTEIFSLAESKGLEIGMEAAIAGAIPIIRTLKSSLASNKIQSIYGILNGTSNYILSKMEIEDLDYSEALSQAQENGFAEKDPTFDVEGIDAAHKVTLLASLTFQKQVKLADVPCEGISQITKMDIQFAKQLGYRIKLLGMARQIDGKLEVRVQPIMLPISHPFASIMNEMNAVYYQSYYAGSGMLVGKGAGGFPTSSAVLADIVYYGKRRLEKAGYETNLYPPASMSDGSEANNRYYLRFNTVDKPGVLAEIAKVLGSHQVSISSVHQNESEIEPAEVVVVTHPCREPEIERAIQEIDSLSHIVLAKSVKLRLEDKL